MSDKSVTSQESVQEQSVQRLWAHLELKKNNTILCSRNQWNTKLIFVFLYFQMVFQQSVLTPYRPSSPDYPCPGLRVAYGWRPSNLYPNATCQRVRRNRHPMVESHVREYNRDSVFNQDVSVIACVGMNVTIPRCKNKMGAQFTLVTQIMMLSSSRL